MKIGMWWMALALALAGCSRNASVRPEAREAAYQENNRGVAQLEQYAYEEAVRSFRRASVLDAQLALPRINLVIGLHYAGDLGAATAAAAEARALAPDSLHVMFVSGLIARAENRSEDAVTAFAQVLSRDPADVGAMINLGQIYVQGRRVPEAVSLFRAAVVQEPGNATALYSLGQALIRSGDREEGARATERFEALRTSGAAVTFSQNYLEQGRYAEAIVSTGSEPELVDRRAPSVRFVDRTATWGPEGDATRLPPGQASPTGATAVALVDLDGDGHLDLVTGDDRGLRLRRWSTGRFVDVTADAGLGSVAGRRVSGIVAADLDGDARPDLLVLQAHGLSILRQTPAGRFEPLGAPPTLTDAFRTAALADVDHDGDLDVLAAGRAATGRGAITLLRNNGQGGFTDVTRMSSLTIPGPALALAPTDFDNRRDIDVMVLVDSRGAMLFQNQRTGSFREVGAETGLPASGDAVALAACDLNKDGFTDFVLANRVAPATLILSTGQGRFNTSSAPAGSEGLTVVQCADYDNDGLLDLVGIGAGRLRVLRNLGTELQDVSAAAITIGTTATTRSISAIPATGTALAALAIGDVDSDGDVDIAALDGEGMPHLFQNDGGSARNALRIRLDGVISNRSAVGSRVDVRAGSLWQKHETAAVSPPIAAQGGLVALGTHGSADVVRVLWPSGILQAETALSPAQTGTVVIAELNRKPSSCPYLYTWNGSGFQFITDFLGGGELGYWTGPHGWNTPDPDEFVRIANEVLRPRNGVLELRVTNELEEALYLDEMQLLSIDHPADVQVYPREGLHATPREGLQMAAVRHLRPLRRVTTESGEDVSVVVAAQDGRSADGFRTTSIRGYAEPHALVLETNPNDTPGAPQVLLLTGWTDYAFSSDNVAAAQRGWSLEPPTLEMRRPGQSWQRFVTDIGVPTGRPQTLVIDIGEAARVPGTEFRLRTNMQIHWDRLAIADAAADVVLRPQSLGLDQATLRWRGYSQPRLSSIGPLVPDYDRVAATSPWKILAGPYTREGDVRPLLQERDDEFVVARTGDEMALSFRAPAMPAGLARTFLLRAVGYSKEMDINSASPDHVLPLPFRGMTRYPGAQPPPATRARQAVMIDRDLTRVVPRTLPALARPDDLRPPLPPDYRR